MSKGKKCFPFLVFLLVLVRLGGHALLEEHPFPSASGKGYIDFVMGVIDVI
jgi:hypothetical protein